MLDAARWDFHSPTLHLLSRSLSTYQPYYFQVASRMDRILIARDAAMSAMSAEQAEFVLMKFWHVAGGVYIWEYTTSLGYEWKILRGQLPYRWTTWIYSISRLAALISYALSFLIMDTLTKIDCQLGILLSVITLCIASTGASLLIVIRTIAIWNHNKVVAALAGVLWVASIVFHILNIVLLVHYQWVPTMRACVPVKIQTNAFGFIPAVIADLILLLITLAGLLILRREGGGVFGLTRLIWRQGIIWLVIGCIVEIPSLVFTLLHTKDLYYHLFESPGQIIMIIAATRMHRTLISFASEPSKNIPTPMVSSLTFPKKNSTNQTNNDDPYATTGSSTKIPTYSDQLKSDSTEGVYNKSSWKAPTYNDGYA